MLASSTISSVSSRDHYVVVLGQAIAISLAITLIGSNNSNDFNHGGKPVPDPNQEGDGKTEAVQEAYDEERGSNNSNDFNHGGKPVPDPNQEGDGKTEAVQEAYDEERDPPVVDKVIPVQDPNQDQGDGKATEDTVEISKLLTSVSVAILIILATSGILVGSTGSRLFTASSFRSHKAMYISIYTVYALDFILTIISILLCVIKPYCHRPRLHTIAGYLVGGSLILLAVVLPLGACAQFISSDQTSSPPPPPPPGLLHHQLKRIPGS